MSFRQTALAIVLTTAAAPAAFANSGSTWIGGEIGFTDHAITGQRTRAEVKQDLANFRISPVTHDGYDVVGGEIGYVPHQHRYVIRDGVRVHADDFTTRMGSGPAPSQQLQRPAFDPYANGGPN